MPPQKKYFIYWGDEIKAFATLLDAKKFCCNCTKKERVKNLRGSYILCSRGGIAIAVTPIIVTTDGFLVFEKTKEISEKK